MLSTLRNILQTLRRWANTTYNFVLFMYRSFNTKAFCLRVIQVLLLAGVILGCLYLMRVVGSPMHEVVECATPETKTTAQLAKEVVVEIPKAQHALQQQILWNNTKAAGWFGYFGVWFYLFGSLEPMSFCFCMTTFFLADNAYIYFYGSKLPSQPVEHLAKQLEAQAQQDALVRQQELQNAQQWVARAQELTAKNAELSEKYSYPWLEWIYSGIQQFLRHGFEQFAEHYIFYSFALAFSFGVGVTWNHFIAFKKGWDAADAKGLSPDECLEAARESLKNYKQEMLASSGSKTKKSPDNQNIDGKSSDSSVLGGNSKESRDATS